MSRDFEGDARLPVWFDSTRSTKEGGNQYGLNEDRSVWIAPSTPHGEVAQGMRGRESDRREGASRKSNPNLHSRS